MNSGQLEVTEQDLIFYQRGKPPIRWPLKTLRRYGFDAEHFTFEFGRRSPTGPGIYAFLCHRAEQLETLLEERLQVGSYFRLGPRFTRAQQGTLRAADIREALLGQLGR